MELSLSGCGDWLDTDTVTAQGAQLMDDTSRGWGLLPGHPWGPHLATSGDFATAMDIWGPVPFPAVARLDAGAVAAAGPLGKEVAGIAATIFPVNDQPPHAETGDREHLLLVGDEPAGRDDLAVMPTPTLDAWAQRWNVSPI